ncbi:MAG: LON peptidase substrate-binding domain-containing protein, partial [Bacteroidetes bacterium]|nr:LON peptidase substrate-binding domain-containing protein [Bacteroidota bacterium]
MIFEQHWMDDANEEDVEMIPLLTVNEEDDEHADAEYNASLPILPIRNNVLFPGVVIPISVGRSKSTKAVNAAYKKDKIIGVISQKDTETEEPEFNDLQRIGTIAKIVKMLKMPDGGTTLIIQGKKRFNLNKIIKDDPYLVGEVEALEEVNTSSAKEVKAFIASMKEQAMKIVELSPNLPDEAKIVIKNINGV